MDVSSYVIRVNHFTRQQNVSVLFEKVQIFRYKAFLADAGVGSASAAASSFSFRFLLPLSPNCYRYPLGAIFQIE